MEIRIDIEDVSVSVNFTNVSEALEERMIIAESDIDSLEADVATNAADILANTALINTKEDLLPANSTEDVNLFVSIQLNEGEVLLMSHDEFVEG